MRILITGAGGFIGSHLAEKCVAQNYRVRAFIRYNSKNNWGWLENSQYKNEIEVITGDIRDFDSVIKTMKDCEAVFHLAALIGIPYSYNSPLAYIQTNIVGTYNVLEAAKTIGCPNILLTSTSETYGTAQYVPIDEKHPLVGQSPYSASKIAADQLAISYYRAYGLPLKIVRPFNTYGPRQSARAVIPTIITQILSGRTHIELGNLAPTRDLTFVKDTAQAFIDIFKSTKLIGEITNIGMGEEISIMNLAGLITSIMGREINILPDSRRVRPDQSEVGRLLADISKLKANTDWRPQYDLQSGLLETIEWIKKNISTYKSEIYNV